MQHTTDRWPDDYEPDGQRSRPGSRRNSACLSRRGSVKEKDVKKPPMNTAPSSTNSTPKKVVKMQNLDFVVTGKQILKRYDRANSLPGTYHRRPSADSITKKRACVSPKRSAIASHSSKSQETSLEDDMSLDLSQVSDFDDANSKYGLKQKFNALATSTPKPQRSCQNARSASLQSQMHAQKMESKRTLKSLDSKQSRESTFSYSRDSLFKTSSTASPHRYGTDLDYSSVSPEYSGQSSADLSPRASRLTDLIASPRSEEMHVSSCGGSSWQDCSEIDNTKIEDHRQGDNGEWNNFWANYNNSVAKVPMKSYYDQCPTPYRTENVDLADFEFSTDGSRIRSPDNTQNLNNIIRNEGLHLTPRETQNMIKCAHIIGSVLSKAIDRRAKEKDINVQELNSERPNQGPEREIKKKTLTLDLKDTNVPVELKEEKRSETVTTQTDISLPNTKSAPKIFENILRQLSRSSINETVEKVVENKETLVENEKTVVCDTNKVVEKNTEVLANNVDENEAKPVEK